MFKYIITVLIILTILCGCEKKRSPFTNDVYLLHPSAGIYSQNYFGITTVGEGKLNPLKPSTVITFSLPQASEVTIWIVPISRDNDESSGTISINGSTLLEIEAGQAVYYVRDNFEAGHHAMEWEAKVNGVNIPSGWYRLYISTGEYFSYRDMLLVYIYEEINRYI